MKRWWCISAGSHEERLRLVSRGMSMGTKREALEGFIRRLHYDKTMKRRRVNQRLVWRRGWAFEVACAEAHAPTEGASPLVYSPRGGTFPPRSPLFESHPLFSFEGR